MTPEVGHRGWIGRGLDGDEWQGVRIQLVLTQRLHGHITFDHADGVQKFHTTPVPRIGGVGLYLGLVAAWALARENVHDTLEPLLIAGLPALAMGLAEDLTRQVSVRTRLLAIPYLDPFDLRYSNRIKVPKPSTQAVMFCLLDVSGSMDQARKDMAKRFFILLYLFLSRMYEHTQVVFIRHHTQAAEVDEHEFFHSRETGGTVVSSALKLLAKTMHELYASSDWNVYVAQASDGDNWDNDSEQCLQLLHNTIMPAVQYYAYVEITDGPPQNLWHAYEQVAQMHPNFAQQRIVSPADIFPVFRELFRKQPK